MFLFLRTFLESQQEPRTLAAFCEDQYMIEAYKEGRDLYATMAAGVYGNKYEDNKEFYPDGTPNPEGKKRRANCKSLLLGLMYGRGVSSIADQLHCDIREAQKISDDFYRGFPRVKQWMEESQTLAKQLGYVEDLWGRRRRLPDIQRPPYEIITNETSFNPLLGSKGVVSNPKNALRTKYEEKLSKCRNYRDKEAIKIEAAREGVTIHDNGGFIAQAERQCVNARIQGSAATMSKKAMILVNKDEELKRLGFKLLLAVHDELIGECPADNAAEAADRLSYLMIESAKPECSVPMKCDAEISSRWFIEDFASTVHEHYTKLREEQHDEILAQHQIEKENPMIDVDALREMMLGTFNCISSTI